MHRPALQLGGSNRKTLQEMLVLVRRVCRPEESGLFDYLYYCVCLTGVLLSTLTNR